MDVQSLVFRTELALAAAPAYSAIRVYRSVGFADGGTHLEATFAPEQP